MASGSCLDSGFPSRPIIRYHGGKWRLAPWIISLMPSHRRYVEPFAGAASVLLRKPRADFEVLADLDGEIVGLFRAARDHGPELRRRLALTPYARAEFKSSYEPSDDPIEQARRTVIRAAMGYGSNAGSGAGTGFRAALRAPGTSTAQDWASYPSALDAIIKRLRGVVIEHRHAHECIAAYDADDALHYIDPPYVPSSRDRGTDYRHEMSEQDHIDLAALLMRVSGAVMISGYRCQLYDDLYAGWRRIDMRAHADGGRERMESIWMSREPRQMRIL